MMKVSDAVEIAQEKFWASIASSYPEATSGDLDPLECHKLDCYLVQVVDMWVRVNIRPNKIGTVTHNCVKIVDVFEYPDGLVKDSNDGELSECLSDYIEGLDGECIYDDLRHVHAIEYLLKRALSAPEPGESADYKAAGLIAHKNGVIGVKAFDDLRFELGDADDRAILAAVEKELDLRGIDCSIEHPDYIHVNLRDGRSLACGTANGTWEADVNSPDMSTVERSFDSQIPGSCTNVAEIAGWIDYVSRCVPMLYPLTK